MKAVIFLAIVALVAGIVIWRRPRASSKPEPVYDLEGLEKWRQQELAKRQQKGYK